MRLRRSRIHSAAPPLPHPTSQMQSHCSGSHVHWPSHVSSQPTARPNSRTCVAASPRLNRTTSEPQPSPAPAPTSRPCVAQLARRSGEGCCGVLIYICRRCTGAPWAGWPNPGPRAATAAAVKPLPRTVRVRRHACAVLG
ncbi:hypothetical protein BT67DRAFT_191748 [Trichocladium antarcticum]|uniref:Uncharacterized protein n=1 Tax=Trichocladium antarcticum TaxID=1450529 RepID=A0AAN6UQ74_9PEZI|nr:hypothetical protein BT67DRAFT_191748 [Trichocladium antarcticum]